MKTLINKANPAIRITAPEIKVNIDTQTFYIGDEMFDMEDWTLVEEEPVVDLEKELQAFLCNYDYEFDDDAIAYDIARHFYELGRIAQIEQNKALADMHKSPKEKEE